MDLTKLRQTLGKLVDELNSPEVIADKAAYEAKDAEIKDLEAQIHRAEEAMIRSKALARPVSAEVVGTTAPNTTTGFRSLGENLAAVVRHYSPSIRETDPRLVRAPSGMSEGDPTSGGFFVQTDIATEIISRSYQMGELLQRVRRLGISTNANGIKIPGVDETSRANGSRWGGVSAKWVAEAGSGTAAAPKFRMIELDLKKLMALWYVTDEMLADQNVLTQVANQAFTEEFTFMTEDSIVRGSGNAQPLGFLNSAAKIAVAKESGQSSGTLVYQNVLNMWSRMWGRSRQNAVWLINQDIEPQLHAMSIAVGTGGIPVYLPAGGISGAPYATLFGRPVIAVEYCETLGTEGDIALVDLSQYIIADKGGASTASSMHVAFLTDEMVFRIIYRLDGQPTWHAPLTPYKGSATKSPFITLATR